MSNKTSKRNIQPSRNIYIDNNRAIYYDPLLKKAHQITKGDEKTFMLFQAGTPVACLIGGLIAYYTRNYYLAIAIGAAIALTVYAIFRFVFIARLPEYPKFQVPERNSMIDQYIRVNSKGKLITNSVVMAVLGIMVIINEATQHYEGLLGILNYAVGAGFLVLAVLCGFAAFRKSE
ncbi:MAG: hypothetical protein IJK53_09990 [Erysipelotrichaceae bacterium]|nr:hypothetical protein [Clostridia bacterium]MBQ6217698.1 hypothetical protein [Erysipelotrichaceae bacterium]